MPECVFCKRQKPSDELMVGHRGMTLSGSLGAQVINTTGRQNRALICEDALPCYAHVLQIQCKLLVKGEEEAAVRAEAEKALNKAGKTGQGHTNVTVRGIRLQGTRSNGKTPRGKAHRGG